jgi:hypothetical protein
VRDPNAELVEGPGSDVVDSDGPAAAEVRAPDEEDWIGSEAMDARDPNAGDWEDVGAEDRVNADVEDRASPVPTFWTLDQTSRFSKKSEASTGMAAFEVNFTPSGSLINQPR